MLSGGSHLRAVGTKFALLKVARSGPMRNAADMDDILTAAAFQKVIDSRTRVLISNCQA